MSDQLTVSLPDGSARELTTGATGADLAADIGPGLARDALIVVVDGEDVSFDATACEGSRYADFELTDLPQRPIVIEY